jgi:hypothetical protein
MIANISCTEGAFGQLKASKQEFEIVDTTSRLRPFVSGLGRMRLPVFDEELRQLAVGLQK